MQFTRIPNIMRGIIALTHSSSKPLTSRCVEYSKSAEEYPDLEHQPRVEHVFHVFRSLRLGLARQAPSALGLQSSKSLSNPAIRFRRAHSILGCGSPSGLGFGEAARWLRVFGYVQIKNRASWGNKKKQR